MATTLRALMQLVISHTFGNPSDLSTLQDKLDLSLAKTLENGVAADQADVVWHDQRTLGAGALETLDLAGSLINAFGQTVTFAKIKGMVIANLSTGRILTIGGAASNPWLSRMGSGTDVFKIGPGGWDAWCEPAAAGFPVTPGTADQLKIANSAGGACDYKIWIIGTSA